MGYMIEGGGSKTLSKAKKWLYANPTESHNLLTILTNIIIDYFVMQVEAGAQILQLFDSSAEYLNKELYTTFGLPYLRRIRAEVKSRLKLVNLPNTPMVKCTYVRYSEYITEDFICRFYLQKVLHFV